MTSGTLLTLSFHLVDACFCKIYRNFTDGALLSSTRASSRRFHSRGAFPRDPSRNFVPTIYVLEISNLRF